MSAVMQWKGRLGVPYQGSKNQIAKEIISQKIETHYAHACEKHPHFADEFVPKGQLLYATSELDFCRDRIEAEKKRGNVYASSILDCELAEVVEAYADGRTEDAIEEIYDSIAVLLRMADLIRMASDK